MNVGIFYADKNRPRHVGEALIEGVMNSGDEVTGHYGDADVIIAYGLGRSHPTLHEGARQENMPNVLVDFGYWRRNFEMYSDKNHYRMSLRHPHPDEYIMHMGETEERFSSYNKQIEPWKMDGEYILLADIGRKSYGFFGMEYQSWAKESIEKLRQHTDRPIVYRAKPSSSAEGDALPGVSFSNPMKESIKQALKNAYVVVTYHSNVGCDALLAGVPIFVQQGAAKPMGLQDLSKIETPYYPTTRFPFFCNLAYCQWSVAEIREGLAWQHMRDRLIPLVYGD